MTIDASPIPPGVLDFVPADRPVSDLCAVARDEDRGNRRTIYPRTTDRDRLTTAWITADASASYDLLEIR